MSFMRVTQGLMITRVLTNLSRQSRRVLDLQNQLATGQTVNSPSDDPIATRLAIDTRTALGQTEQYIANMQAATPLLAETESAISTSMENVERASTLAQQGASETYNQSQLDNIAVEVNQILESLVSSGNHQTNGRYIFGGTRTTSQPFVVTRNAAGEITGVSYAGNDQHTQVAISDGVQINTNETGKDVFLSKQDVFQTMIELRDSLRSGDRATIRNATMGKLEDIGQQFLQSESRVGSIENRIERTTDDLGNFSVEYESLLSDTIDADYAETVISLNAQSNAYEAALNAAARVIQPSLLDFIN
jgi:flagellar hook-associated protein 3 FlgL